MLRFLDSRVNSVDHLAADDPQVVALVSRAVAREQAAFAELYDRYLDCVYRYASYRTGNRTDAEDLTEQTFLQAWSAIERFRWQGKPFLAWLYTVAHNLVIDWRRRSAASQSLDDGEHLIDMESTSAARALVQWIDTELLGDAIKRLTPEQQQVIILKFIDGFDTARVAQVMDKREGAVRAPQLRALQSLRRHLDGQDEGMAA